MLNKVRVSSDKKRALRQTKLEIPQLHMHHMKGANKVVYVLAIYTSEQEGEIETL